MTHFPTTFYLRVKRTNITAFVYTEVTETIGVLKEKIRQIVTDVFPTPYPEEIRLCFGDVVLEDSKTIGDYAMDKSGEVGPVVFLLFQDAEGVWEIPHIHDPKPKGVVREQLDMIVSQEALGSGRNRGVHV